MKTLVLYDSDGKISLTQEITDDKTYECFIEDIPSNKQPVSVDVENKKCILENTKDEDLELKNEELTDKVIELTAQNLINSLEED